MNDNDTFADFVELSPDFIVCAAEDALGVGMTGFASSLPSYINRVYEVESTEKDRFIIKFYRPGRWTYNALVDEHNFVLDCEEAEIPVIAPLELEQGGTIGERGGIYFTIYPKRWGRQLELNTEDDWLRLGRLLGRLHMVGAQDEAPYRLRLHPEYSLKSDIDFLLDGDYVDAQNRNDFEEVSNALLAHARTLDFDSGAIRLHGDCHRANLLERPDEGLMMIDFDDMLTGPPVQDMWLLLPAHLHESRMEVNLIIEGYEQFRYFDYGALSLIEPLRAMRIIYFLAWCAKQRDDFSFHRHFPNWGDHGFWRKEISDLRRQLSVIEHYGS